MLRIKRQFPAIDFTKAQVIWLACAIFLLTFFGFGVPSARGQAFGPGYAINLDGTNGYVQVTNGVWFSSDFTIEGWVFVRSYNSWSRLLDFADGPNANNVYLALSYGTNGYPTMGVFTNNGTPILEAGTQLPTNQWVHLAGTLSGTNGTIYINGIPVASGPLNVAPNVIRTNNYIGRSNYSSDKYANAMFDEIRIWNVARTQAQIQSTMHVSLSASTPGLVALWRFDELSGTNTVEAVSGVSSELVGGATLTNSGIPFIPYTLALSPTSIAGSTASFSGIVNPGNLPTTTWFAWGTTTNYGNTTTPANIPAFNGEASAYFVVSNLSPGVIYHYAVAATNSAGTNISEDVQFAMPTTRTVTTTNEGLGAGTLRTIIDASLDGDIVNFAVTGTIVLTNELNIGRSISIVGPGANQLSVNANSQNRVFDIVSTTAVVQISGLTVYGGSVIGTSTTVPNQGIIGGAVFGGGIANLGNLTLIGCSVFSNSATGGDGINESGGSSLGGGIYSSGPLTLVNCMVADNIAQGGFEREDGGNAVNYASGGGIYCSDQLIMTNSSVWNNSVFGGGADSLNGGAADGGGIHVGSAQVGYMLNCTICNNSAVGGSASGFYDSRPAGGNATGGGLSLNTNFTIISCTISENSCTGGSGIVDPDNEDAGGSASGGGINLGSSTGSNLRNSIVAGNFTIAGFGTNNISHQPANGTATGPDISGTLVSVGYNLIGAADGSSGWVASDLTGTIAAALNPLLGPIQDNGGPTFTMALPPDSAAVDHGDDSVVIVWPFDQRGSPRFSGANVDIGAFELFQGLAYLNITHQPGTVVLSWQTTNTGYTLQQNTNLATSTWVTVPGTPSIVGQQYVLTNTAAGTDKNFYRLSHP
jgi:Concanavalin A-like lectin/glucanases superfamily